MALNPGDLIHLVTIQVPGAVTPDGQGGFTQAWVSLTPDEWASIAPATARDLERTMAGSVSASSTHLVRLHFREDVTVRGRILHRRDGHVATDAAGAPTVAARVFQVTGLQNVDEQDVELCLSVVEAL